MCQRVVFCSVVSVTKQMRLPKLKVPPKLLNVRNYKRFNLNAFRQDMSSVPFDEIACDANEMWTLLKAFFSDILNMDLLSTYKLKAIKSHILPLRYRV